MTTKGDGLGVAEALRQLHRVDVPVAEAVALPDPLGEIDTVAWADPVALELGLPDAVPDDVCPLDADGRVLADGTPLWETVHVA